MIKRAVISAALLLACLTTVPNAAVACSIPAASEALQAEALKAVNAERAVHGLRALTFSRTLDKAAQGAACDNANRREISHVSSDGSHLKDRLHRVGYRYRSAAENTGRGFRSGTSAVDWWMHSPKHKANILMNSVNEIGIGIALSDAPDNKLHWILNMGDEK
ncbi:MAG: CAP domain-containing protein [Rhodoferax sp.]|nr:CAP domain-containing protein [Pseudorhodobacter sp.]